MIVAITLHVAPVQYEGWRYRLAKWLAPELFDGKSVTVTFSATTDGQANIAYRVHPELDIVARSCVVQPGGARIEFVDDPGGSYAPIDTRSGPEYNRP